MLIPVDFLPGAVGVRIGGFGVLPCPARHQPVVDAEEAAAGRSKDDIACEREASSAADHSQTATQRREQDRCEKREVARRNWCLVEFAYPYSLGSVTPIAVLAIVLNCTIAKWNENADGEEELQRTGDALSCCHEQVASRSRNVFNSGADCLI